MRKNIWVVTMVTLIASISLSATCFKFTTHYDHMQGPRTETDGNISKTLQLFNTRPIYTALFPQFEVDLFDFLNAYNESGSTWAIHITLNGDATKETALEKLLVPHIATHIKTTFNGLKENLTQQLKILLEQKKRLEADAALITEKLPDILNTATTITKYDVTEHKDEITQYMSSKNRLHIPKEGSIENVNRRSKEFQSLVDAANKITQEDINKAAQLIAKDFTVDEC